MSDATIPRSAPLPPPPEPSSAHYEKCPHCGNATLVEPSTSLVYRCGICGKARVPLDRPGYQRSGDETAALARASAAHASSSAWRAGSVFLALFAAIGLLSLGLVTTALNPGAVALAFGLLIALIPAGLAAHGFRRAGQLQKEVAPALEEGWLSVARELIEQDGSITDVELARALRVDRPRAEQLLVQLASTSDVRHRLDEAPLAFEASRARVATGAVGADSVSVAAGQSATGAGEPTDDELAAAEALAQADAPADAPAAVAERRGGGK